MVLNVRFRLVTVLLLLTMVIVSYASIAQSGSEQVTLTGWVMVPAVSDSGGSLINVTVTIKVPGSGVIRVEGERGESSIGEVTRSSMIMAVKTGSLYAGYYWGSLDAIIRIGTREEVEGPSGSFAVALLTYMLLAYNSNVGIKGYTITGAISPDGLSSRVGGVSVKCSVAQRSGYVLVLPLANVPDVGLNCRSMAPVSGLLSGLSVLRGLPSFTVNVTYTLPEDYNRGMRDIASDMVRRTENLLSKISQARLPWPIEWIRGNLSRAKTIIDDHPYAAASLAFVAYVQAKQSEYYMLLSERGVRVAFDELSGFRSEIRELKMEMDSLPRSGSIYYVEFLATAYTRLADANSTLLYLESAVRGGGDIGDIAYYLGFTRARLDSVRAWISLANILKDERPVIGEDTVRSVTLIFGSYVKASVDYASHLVEYVIRAYDLPQVEREQLQVYLEVVKGLIARGDSELSKGNYLAALGFYREAFSKSLARLFTPPSVMTGDIARGYVGELLKLQSLLTSTIITRGLVSGLAPAYSDYAMVRYELGDLNASIDLLEEAVASTILWYTLTLRTTQLLGTPVQVGEQAPSMVQPSGVDAMNLYAIASLLILLSFLLGVTLSAWLSYRAMRST